MKRILALFFAAAMLLCTQSLAVSTLEGDAITIAVPSAALMEKTTGSLIYGKNSHERLSPASVTKVMTMLLIVEELDGGKLSENDIVTASSHAASMGGSQIWLEEGEQMTVHEMLKCIAVSSANDCSVALAEHISGSEEAFVARMNQRAAELGLADTHFTNCTGLFESESHYTSAYDIAVMSRELLQHDMIKEYTTIWMDKVRNGEFGLSNTNKLIYYYNGATGLKTGFTSTAMYCLSASAERNGVEYIAVVMHGETSKERFESAKTLLNFAFANYALVSLRPDEAIPPVHVELGEYDSVQPVIDGPQSLLLEKDSLGEVTYSLDLPESISAPVLEGQKLGMLTIKIGDHSAQEIPMVAGGAVARLGRWDIFRSLIRQLSVSD